MLKGEETPHDDAERLQLAWHAQTKSLNAGSARLFAEALANDPKLADDRQGPRTATTPPASPRSPRLARARTTRRTMRPPKPSSECKPANGSGPSLSAWAKVLETGPAEMKAKVAPTLQHWKEDTDLAGIRDEKELAKLPEDERTALKQLWNDVDQLLIRAVATN